MLNFIRFLSEGGNLPFVDPNNPHKGERVSDSIESGNRDTQREHFHQMFHSINTGFQKRHGHSLFGNALNTNKYASGSAEGYMDPSISTERFKKAKPSMGDFDVQVPKEHKQKLEQYLEPGQVHGKFKVIHVRKGGTQTHAIVQHQDTGQHHQIDFEPVEYDEKTQEPKPFERFAHNSHINDLEKGLKGVHHKYLLQSIPAAHAIPSIISKTTGRGKAKTETQEEGNVAPHTFSVDKGMREKWEKVGEKDGKPIVKEKDSKTSEYTKDLPTIYNNLFKRKGSESDIQDIHHFGGLVDHIKKHIPQEHHGKIFNAFVNKLWHPTAQETSVDRETDRKVKQSAYDEMAKHFPAEHLARQKETEAQKKEYYDPNNPKKFKFAKKTQQPLPTKDTENNPIKEAKEEDFHVAAVMGRFNGPTKEHAKLLDKLFSQKAHKHHVFVMGPETKEQTTDKDPMTADEKVSHLKRLYPEHADSFIPGTHRHTKNPHKAITWMWHQHQKPGRNVHLSVIAGSGETGIKNKSSAGGSADSYRTIIQKGNGTRFPKSVGEDGSIRGGDYKFNYKTANVIENPRGEVSGSVVRHFAKSHDHNNPEHVKQFMGLLDPRVKEEHAKEIMKTMKERSSLKENLTLAKLKGILGI